MGETQKPRGVQFVARSAARYWDGILDAGPLPWLAALDPSWDLIALADDEWERLACRDRLVDALDSAPA